MATKSSMVFLYIENFMMLQRSSLLVLFWLAYSTADEQTKAMSGYIRKPTGISNWILLVTPTEGTSVQLIWVLIRYFSSSARFIMSTDDILITFNQHATPPLSLYIYIYQIFEYARHCHMKDVMTPVSICEVRIPCELLLLLLLSFPKPLMPHGISLSWYSIII